MTNFSKLRFFASLSRIYLIFSHSGQVCGERGGGVSMEEEREIIVRSSEGGLNVCVRNEESEFKSGLPFS